MSKPKRKSPKTLLSEIATDALCYRALRDPAWRGRIKGDVPGEWIKRLPKEKREILEQLKSDDIKDDRLLWQPFADEKPYRPR